MTGRFIRLLVLHIWLLSGVIGMVVPDLVQSQEKPPKLNPYTGNADAIQEGKKFFVTYGCSACHGLGGGGGMGIPIIDEVWKYGGDDATLMKLIKGEITESPMPKFGHVLNEEQIWKIIAYVRSLYQGDPASIQW